MADTRAVVVAWRLLKKICPCRRNCDCVAMPPRLPQGHVTCVTEYEKYALAATKPGGAAANGVNRQQPAAQSAGEPTGTEFLSTRPPWKCRCALALGPGGEQT